MAEGEESRPGTSQSQRFEQQEDVQWWNDQGWIDLDKLDWKAPLQFVTMVDGSGPSFLGLRMCIEYWMQTVKKSKLQVVHIRETDEVQAKQPRKLRSHYIESEIDSTCSTTLAQSRYKLVFRPKFDTPTIKEQLCERCDASDKSFAIIGCYGSNQDRKKRMDELGSTAVHLLQNSHSAVVVVHDDDQIPFLASRWGNCKNAGARYVVSVANNQASTKAFFDALFLSSEGDTVEVVHLVCDSSRGGADKHWRKNADMLKAKYEAMFESTTMEYLLKGRTLKFTLVDHPAGGKISRESVVQSLVDYAESVAANFVVVGTVTVSDSKIQGRSVSALLAKTARCAVVISHFEKKGWDTGLRAHKAKMLAEKEAEQDAKEADLKQRLRRLDSHRLDRETSKSAPERKQ